MDFCRYDGETEDELLVRIVNQKDKLGLTWDHIADILNELLGKDMGESAYRKKWARKFRDNEDTISLKCDCCYDDRNNEIDDINENEIYRRELEKEKIKYRDERNEYYRLIRQEARKESYVDLVKKALSEVRPREIGDFQGTLIDGDNDLIIHVTDVHTGIEINNFFNRFDESVLRFRFAKYLNDIEQIQCRHNSENAYVIISEVISGLIHENLRLENNQNLIEQFLTITEYLADFLDRLSRIFNVVNVYVCPGNHSRVNPKKEQNLKGENFDHLIIPYLSAKLQLFDNIKFYENKLEESIAVFNVRGNVVYSAHGDKDDPKTVVQKLTLLFEEIPNLVYLGHRHFNAMTTVNNTKIISSGCWCGVDNYALDLRLKTRPEQTVSVVNKDGLVCVYDIQLDA